MTPPHPTPPNVSRTVTPTVRNLNRATLAIILLILLIIALPLNAAAIGNTVRPTPPALYPAPGVDPMGAQAYPPPVPVIPAITPTPGPMPTPETFGPTDPDPRDGYAYSWGYLARMWLVTLDGVGFGSDILGVQCIRHLNTLTIHCYDLQWIDYDYATDRNVYQAPVPYCLTGGWEVYSVYMLGRFGDIRQPNIYSLTCILHLPTFQEG